MFEPTTRIIRQGERVFPFQPDRTVGQHYDDVVLESPAPYPLPPMRRRVKLIPNSTRTNVEATVASDDHFNSGITGVPGHVILWDGEPATPVSCSCGALAGDPVVWARQHLAAAIAAATDFTRATKLTVEIEAEIEAAFNYQPWDGDQTARGAEVRAALAAAVKVIVRNVPPCPDRSSAIRMIRQARMEANSAITHRGKY